LYAPQRFLKDTSAAKVRKPEVFHNSAWFLGIRRSMKKIILALFALLFLAPLVPTANAQVIVKLGHSHRHCWYSHHHRHCR